MTALIEREGNLYVALGPEVDLVSQGATIKEARSNLVEALTLFFEHADPSETVTRLKKLDHFEEAVGYLIEDSR